jgi:hypothetical protein
MFVCGNFEFLQLVETVDLRVLVTVNANTLLDIHTPIAQLTFHKRKPIERLHLVANNWRRIQRPTVSTKLLHCVKTDFLIFLPGSTNSNYMHRFL